MLLSERLKSDSVTLKSVTDTRTRNLELLAVKVGSIADINEKLGRRRNDPYLYSVLNGVKNRTGSPRSLGRKLCADIERAYSFPAGYMSADHSSGGCAADICDSGNTAPDSTDVCLKIPGIDAGAPAYCIDKTAISAPAYSFRYIKLQSDDMAPSFIFGDIAIIDTRDTAPAAGVYLLDIAGVKIIRRLTPDLFGRLFISADSLPAQSSPLDTAQHKILGRAVYMLRCRKI